MTITVLGSDSPGLPVFVSFLCESRTAPMVSRALVNSTTVTISLLNVPCESLIERHGDFPTRIDNLSAEWTPAIFE
jgi:hypothetical protein